MGSEIKTQHLLNDGLFKFKWLRLLIASLLHKMWKHDKNVLQTTRQVKFKGPATSCHACVSAQNKVTTFYALGGRSGSYPIPKKWLNFIKSLIASSLILRSFQSQMLSRSCSVSCVNQKFYSSHYVCVACSDMTRFGPNIFVWLHGWYLLILSETFSVVIQIPSGGINVVSFCLKTANMPVNACFLCHIICKVNDICLFLKKESLGLKCPSLSKRLSPAIMSGCAAPWIQSQESTCSLSLASRLSKMKMTWSYVWSLCSVSN